MSLDFIDKVLDGRLLIPSHGGSPMQTPGVGQRPKDPAHRDMVPRLGQERWRQHHPGVDLRGNDAHPRAAGTSAASQQHEVEVDLPQPLPPPPVRRVHASALIASPA